MGFAPTPGPALLLPPTLALLTGFVFEESAPPVRAAADGAAGNATQGPVLREGFRIGPLRLAIRYEDGSELTDLPPVHRLPRAPAWFCGMANLHGALVPVFDPAELFGIAHDVAAKPMLLVLGHGDARAGIVIDGLPVRLRLATTDRVENAASSERLAACTEAAWWAGGADWLDLQVGALLDQLEGELAAAA